MTTVNELIEILVSVKKWNGENPVIVLVDGKQMAVDQVIDVGYAGGNEAVILECRNESLRKVPRPCSYSDSQRKIQDEITERDLALIRSIRAGGEIPPQTSREILQIVALSPSVKPRSPELPAIGRRPYDGLNGEIILENAKGHAAPGQAPKIDQTASSASHVPACSAYCYSSESLS